MALKMEELNDGSLIQIGKDVRIERRFMPEHEGEGPKATVKMLSVERDGRKVEVPHYKWIVYERVHTGVEFGDKHKDAVKAGAHRDENDNVLAHMVKKAGQHPVIKDAQGNPAQTNEEYVWVPRHEVDGTDEEVPKQALAHARKLAGE